MDDGERILSHSPRPALDDFPCLRMCVRVERLGRSAHVALGFKLSGAFRQHLALRRQHVIVCHVDANHAARKRTAHRSDNNVTRRRPEL